MSRSSFAIIAGVAIVGLGLMHTTAMADNYKGEGTVSYVADQLSAQKLADGTTLTHTHLKGTIVADDATNPLHLMPQDCVGANLVSAEGVPVRQSGSCSGADANGDIWMMTYSTDGTERTWQFVGGTGKFANVSGGGTTRVLAGTADGRLTISWHGAWSM